MDESRFTLSVEECRRRTARQSRTMLLEDAKSSGAQSGRSYFFEDPVQWIEIRSLEEIPQAFSAIEQASADGLWVAGYLSYECGYHWEPQTVADFRPSAGLPLGAFGVYRAPVVPVRRDEDEVRCGLADVALSLSSEEFREQLDRVQEWISAGDSYQVNLTCCVESSYTHGAAALFAHMMRAQPVEFGAMLNLGDQMVLSASPELFFQLTGRDLRVRPMKGTSRRGSSLAEDEELAAALALDEKNRAENVMIVDLLRSDIGRIAETGSVRVRELFKVERHPSLLQMTSTIEATLREGLSFYDLFRALFPCGSIVGAPKVRAMQIIRTLEGRDRGVYTGAIGYITPQRDAVFSVAIRTAVLEHGRLSMGVGAGITAGSEAAAEYSECLLKGEFLRDCSFELIESMRWEAGGCALLELHLNRLERSANFFGFAFDRKTAQSTIEEYASQLSVDKVWKLRLCLNTTGSYTISSSEVDVPVSTPLIARLWPEPVQSSDLWLRHKTTLRAFYDEAHDVAQVAGCVDALFLNEAGMVAEGAIHSILVCHGDRWRTPPLAAGVLPGVYREHLLAVRPEISEEDIHGDELWTADHIYLMNAVRGLRRVELRRELMVTDSPHFAESMQLLPAD